jgi:hypothetical protein
MAQLLKTGFSQASGELIGFLDADGTYPPEYFPKLCEERLDGSDLVVGSRMSGEDSQMPAPAGSGISSSQICSACSEHSVSPTAPVGCGCFKREVLDFVYPLPDGFNLTPVMSTRAVHEGINMRRSPHPLQRAGGRSKAECSTRWHPVFAFHAMDCVILQPGRILGFLGWAGVAVALLVA